MTYKTFSRLWRDALAQPDKELYIGEYGYPDFFSEISDDIDEIVSTLGHIHDIAHMSIRSIIQTTGLSQAAFATRLCIPLRSIEDWATGKHKCADYIRLLICKDLGLLKISIEEKNYE